jgi:hypothetical protein
MSLARFSLSSFSLSIWLTLSSGAAWAQQTSTFSPEGTDCGLPSAIMGTSGLRNAAEAIQTNANTYSAAAFAARHLMRPPEDGGFVVYDINVTYAAARVPVWQPASLDRPDDCFAENRVAMRPLDLQAANFGFTWRKGNFGFIYAGSATYGGVVGGDQFTRHFLTGFVGLTYMLAFSAAAAPLDLVVPGPTQFNGASAGLGLDWLAGATWNGRGAHAAAAYMGSRGGYASVAEDRFGFYAFGARTTYTGNLLQVGVDRAQLGFLGDQAADLIGLSSVAYQDLPFTGAGLSATPAEAEEDPSLAESLARLRAGQLQQRSLFRVADLMARYRFEPQAAVSDLTLGLHTPDFHSPRTGEVEDRVGALVQGGFVSPPASWSQGNGPGRLPSGRLELAAQGEGRSAPFEARVALLYNDPDQLQLYPFARNAVSWQALIKGGF